MNAKQTKEAQMLVLVDEFNDQRAASFTHKTLTSVDKKFAEASAILKEAIKSLGGKAAIQASGTFGQQTEEKRTLRQDLEDEMRNYNRTAAAIAEATQNPGLMDRFRMPQGSGDGELKTKARAFAAAIRELSLNDEFEAHGHGDEDENGKPLTPDAVLDAMAADFEAGEGSKGNALSVRAGATQAIPVHLREGKGAVKTFDAIYNNVYKDDAGMLGAWKTMSHVERTGASRKAVQPTPAPTGKVTLDSASASTAATNGPTNGAASNGASANTPTASGTSGNGIASNASNGNPANAGPANRPVSAGA